MKAVFSFCSKFVSAANPYVGFADDTSFACSCILSVLLAKKNVGRTELYTDQLGAEFFARLKLPFDAVHVIFNDFPYPSHLWMASKLETYQIQTEPFVHIDLDAYLWSPLPQRLAGAGFIAQSSEDDFAYYDGVLAYFLNSAGYIPDFVRDHAAQHGSKVRALNAGIYGGHNLEAIRACCTAALKTINHPANVAMFANLSATASQVGGLYYDFNVLLEQYFAAVYCHQQRIDLRYVLSNQEPPYFTHLMAASKRHPTNAANLVARVAQDYPYYYSLLPGLTLLSLA